MNYKKGTNSCSKLIIGFSPFDDLFGNEKSVVWRNVIFSLMKLCYLWYSCSCGPWASSVDDDNQNEIDKKYPSHITKRIGDFYISGLYKAFEHLLTHESRWFLPIIQKIKINALYFHLRI